MNGALALYLITSATLLQQIEAARPNIDHDYAVAIAGEVTKVCEKQKIDCHLIIAIMAQESMFRLDAVGRGGDFGIMQVSSYNVKAHKLSKSRLLTDLNYSIAAGVKILKYFQKRYKSRESAWWCRYNVGTGHLGPNRTRLCKQYVDSVLRFYPTERTKVRYERAAIKRANELYHAPTRFDRIKIPTSKPVPIR